MLDLINFIGAAIVFNLLFFLYASSKMKNKWNPVQTTVFAFLFNVPLAILVACVYSITLAYAVYLGAGEEWVWEYLEHNTAQD
jgi:heme/copper-type cytochrome/quinol oxidase subunit 4